jgi:tape measure domain-containing protein
LTEPVDLELDLSGNTAAVAKKMAAELRAVEQRLDGIDRAHSKVERAFAKTKAFSPQRFRDLQNHANAVVRLRKAHTALAPASAWAARSLRMLGVSGAPLRRLSIDAAKTETAFRRLYRLRGGGLAGAGAVAGSMARRGVARYGGAAAGIAGRGAMGLAGGVAGGAALAGGAAVAGAGLLGWNMAATAIEAERVKFALDSITKGQGDQWWATAADYAQRFGLNVNAVADNLMNMKASGFTDDTTKLLFLRMGDLRSLGATEETIGRALLAIRQVQAAGRLQGDELNQLSEAGINTNFVYASLAKTLNKTVPEIIKMKEAGKLTSDVVIPAIADAIGAKTGGGAAGEAGAAAAKGTVIGQWGRLKGAFSVATTNAIGAGELAPLRDAIGNFTNWISGPGGQAAIGAFGGVMTRMFAAAPDLINKVIWLLDSGIPAAWNAFTTSFQSSGGSAAIDAITAGFGSMAGENGVAAESSLVRIGSAAGQLAGSLVTLTGMLIQAVEWIGKLGDVWGFIDKAMWLTPLAPVKALQAGISMIGGAANDNGEAGSMNQQGYDTGLSMAHGIAAGMYAGAPGVMDASTMLGRVSNDAIRTDQEINSPSRKMAMLGDYMSQGVAVGMTRRIPTIEEASNRVSGSATSAVAGGAASAGGGQSVVIQVFVDGKDVTGKSGGEIGDLIGERIERKLISALRRAS